MPKKVRVGIVGTNFWPNMMHLPALQSHPQAEITAICGRNRDRAEEVAQKYKIPQVFTDYQAMIDQSDIEALIVSTPDDLHHPITMAALEAKLHVLCEKPLALTLENANEMASKAEVAGVKQMTYFTWRWLPPFQYLHQLIQEGYLGKHYYSQFRYVAGYGRNNDYRWKWDANRGLGILGDLGVHMIDLAHWLIGDIDKVNAHLSAFMERSDINNQPLKTSNDAALLTLKFQDGSQGLIQVSALAHLGDRGQQFQIILYGEDGTLEVDCTFKDGYQIRGAKSDENQIKPLVIPDDIYNGVDPKTAFNDQFGQIFTQQSVGVRLFIDSIINDNPVSPNFIDGAKAQSVIEAAMISDQRECWIPVSSD